ncbi:Hypothetical protein CINCED_3A011756 [Cinara cedri]|uniref:Uncharacterized protein n=1 Tax=Cinara cedri TaxID=506608 RepID=A0A5E4MIR3_9HEMI|nr:Hypothetical protein CINCED_3A011756 [Cinara cedri]
MCVVCKASKSGSYVRGELYGSSHTSMNMVYNDHSQKLIMKDKVVRTTKSKLSCTCCGLALSAELNSKEYDIVRVLNNVEFEHLDSNVQCYDQNENVDDAIIQSIQDKHDLDEDTDEEPDPPIRLQEAKKCLEILRLFFLQQENKGSPINTLDACSDYIRQQSIIRKKQTFVSTAARQPPGGSSGGIDRSADEWMKQYRYQEWGRIHENGRIFVRHAVYF